MSDAKTMVFVDPAVGIEIRPLEPALDETAAPLLTGTACVPPGGTEESVLAAMRGRGDLLYQASTHGGPVAVYGLRREGMANVVSCLAVREDARRQGYGRICLQDALRRSGRRPLVVETTEALMPFYKACGFKLVGRRMQPDGSVHYRLGWHAPGRHFKGGASNALRRPGE